jgi:hypothetical protein
MADDRGHAMKTTQNGTPHRYGTGWLVPSQTTAGVRYYVNADATRCTCRGFAYRGTCAHLRTVLAAQQLIGEMLGNGENGSEPGAENTEPAGMQRQRANATSLL